MSILEFVSDLRKLDVRLSANGQHLRLNAPKGVLTDTLRAQITERKQELLQFLSDYEQSAPCIRPPILQRTNSDPTPLSFAQERLWFLEQLESGSAAYNICRASCLRGQLNVAALEASLSEIVRRHEILRSQIRIVDGRSVQVAVAVSRFELPLADLRSFTDTEREREVRDRIRAQAEWQFDFSAGLFLRAMLLQFSDDQHILILTTHHIVADAWSMGILTRELWELYEAYANGRASPLQELPIQYADYAAWQHHWLQGEVLETQLSYWRKKLENIPVLNLLADHVRPAKQSFRGARQSVSLPEALTKAVNELSEREGVTQFMTLLAAFQVLLYRYSGQEDVVIGSPIANRNGPEVEGLIGFFVNTLVLRADLSEKPTFKELLQRVRNVCLGAYAHQDLPFEKLVEELQPERDLSRNPLFQVMFALQNTPRSISQPNALSIERVDVLPTTSLFDLSLYLREREAKLIGFVEYNTELFDSSTIERMIGHFETLLEGIVGDPERPISTLPILIEAERHQLLVEWNSTDTEYPKDLCIHELFEAQAATTPEAIALEFEGKQLTYRELNRQANQLAHYLRRLEIAPEKLVGICIERSIEMVIGLLGILKAGGAYVPLDPSYPRERLAFMLDDSQASVLLTQAKLVEDGRWRMDDSDPRSSILHLQIKFVCLDSDWEAIARESEQNIHSAVKPNNLAYVIYTSGSTGQPKGVAIEHRNTVAFLHWANSIFTPEELRGVLTSTSICFDLSIFELFVPLSWGGKVILVENVMQLSRSLGRHQVTLINTVPSAMSELLRINPLPESLRTVNLAGEPLRSDLVEQIYGRGNVNKVYDLYGPSETTTYSTFTLRASNQRATIGRPIGNSRIYILDDSLRPVPVGVTGEIYIGGAGVARGYLNRSELTAAMFIADPFREGQGDRLYRTGDRGRYRPDGNIELIGRMDDQVKIRGYRIELGEIETVLTEHPTVKDCVVVAREREADSGKTLVGYVVSAEHSVPSVTELRRYLKEKLPECMIPSSFVVLEALPLMPNGKVDRNRLPTPDGTRHPLTREFGTPRGEIEELIGQMWREVLKIENIGIYDNFFDLGGHSLLATQIVAGLHEAFNKDVPLRVLFDAPTIAELAQELETIIRDERVPDLPPIVPVPRDRPVPLSVNQEHLWRLDQAIPGTHFFSMPYVYRLTGNLNVEALEKALKEIIRRHEALRTVFAEVDGRPVQIIKDGSDFELSVEDLRRGDPDAVSQKAAALILQERERPFDLAKGPMLRTQLLRLTDAQYVLLVTMHHIISDQRSMQIFRKELVTLYEAYSRGRPSPLQEPVIQFADFASWERRLLEEGFLNTQLAFWKKQLNGPASQLEFQKNGKGSKELNVYTTRQLMELDATLFTGIRSLARRENCTTFMVLVTALNILLHLYTRQRDIRIGFLVANRGRRETEEVMGHFVNTMILRTYLNSEATVRQLLRQVRRVALMADAHQHLPFEQLAQVLEGKDSVNRGSLFQVLLNYQHRHLDSFSIAGLTLASVDLQQTKEDLDVALTTFDLIVDIKESSTTLTGYITYNANVIGQERVNRMAESFMKLLEKMTAYPVKQIESVLVDCVP